MNQQEKKTRMAKCNVETTSGLLYGGATDISILESSQQHGYHFEYSCNSGKCGVCKTALLRGDIVELKPQRALSAEDSKAGRILTCCCAPKTDILIDAENLAALKDIEVKTLPVRISKIVRHSDDIIEIVLRFPPSAQFKFLEGQFIDVIGPEGVKRSYSVANSSDEKTIILFIKKLEQGVLSQYWFHTAKENDLLRIEGPKGSFFFREIKKHIIFLVTGTGIAPVKAMLDMLVGKSDLFRDVSFSLYWGNRNPEDFFFQPDYQSMNLNFFPILSRDQEGWKGRLGYVQDSLVEDNVDLKEAQVYACGSLQMIESAHALLLANGLDEKSFHSDAFVSS